MAVHGWARYSADVDLLTMDSGVLAADFWLPSHAVTINAGDVEDPLAGVVRWPVVPPHDLNVGRGAAMRFAVESCEPNATLACPVATPVALVLLKLEAGGVQDLYDIEGLVGACRMIDGAPWLAQVEQQAHLMSLRAQNLWAGLRERLG